MSSHPNPAQHVLQFFGYDQRQKEGPREVSRRFHALAHELFEILPMNPETTVAMRKLLEAKDAAVRSKFLE